MAPRLTVFLFPNVAVSTSIAAPTKTTVAESHIQVMNAITAPSEP
jgi:hypothetical protein